jgi:acetoacetyl-CoA synthetase
MLGCDVRAFDESGRECPVNVTGELVVVKPMPSMPVGLWGDHSGDRFRSTYFETYPGLWHHGDWITFFNDGACLISGRSDATLNRGGVRLGTADFYAVIDSREEISDSLVIHVEDRDGGPGVLYLLIVPAPGHAVDSALKSTLSGVLRRELSPRHVPDVVVEIPAVPRTLSGKKLEVPVKRLLQGHDAQGLASRESLLDPNAWDAIVEWSQSIV